MKFSLTGKKMSEVKKRVKKNAEKWKLISNFGVLMGMVAHDLIKLTKKLVNK